MEISGAELQDSRIWIWQLGRAEGVGREPALYSDHLGLEDS